MVCSSRPPYGEKEIGGAEAKRGAGEKALLPFFSHLGPTADLVSVLHVAASASHTGTGLVTFFSLESFWETFLPRAILAHFASLMERNSTSFLGGLVKELWKHPRLR